MQHRRGRRGIRRRGPARIWHRHQRGLRRQDRTRRPQLDAGLEAVRTQARTRGCAECSGGALRRHRVGCLVALRRSHRDAGDAAPGRQRGDVLAVAHHRTVLTHPVVFPHRTQSPCQPVRGDHRGLQRFPRRRCATARAVRHHRSGVAGQRLQHLLDRQEPQRSRRGRRQRRQQVVVAAAAGLRPVLRLPRRGDQQLVPGPDRGQPVHRAALQPGRGLPPVQRPCRPSDPDAARPEIVQPVQAVVHVVLPGRQSRPASQPAGIRRQVQGQVRRWLRGLPGLGAGPDDRQRCVPQGHQDDADQPTTRGRRDAGRRGTAVGVAQRRREETVLSDGGGLCGILGVHRRPGRSDHRLPREDRSARQHDRVLLRRQRRLRRGLTERFGQ